MGKSRRRISGYVNLYTGKPIPTASPRSASAVKTCPEMCLIRRRRCKHRRLHREASRSIVGLRYADRELSADKFGVSGPGKIEKGNFHPVPPVDRPPRGGVRLPPPGVLLPPG